MSTKRSGFPSLGSIIKRRKSGEDTLSYFQKTLQDCGLKVKDPPEKCLASKDTVIIIRNLQKELMGHDSHKVEKFFEDFKKACNDMKKFEHYLFPNIMEIDNSSNVYDRSDSVIKILLNVTFLQNNLITFIFDQLMDFTEQQNFEMWVKAVLKSLSGIVSIENSEILATKLIELLDITLESDRTVRLEIISAIPDVIGDREHDYVASEMRRIMSTNSELLPSILDCLTFLCISDEQYKLLQQETLKNMQQTNAAFFPNFISFLLMPDRLSDNTYEETIKGIRKELGWTSLFGSQEDIASSQVLTATAIRNSMLSSKAIAKAWLNVLSSCNISTDHKPIDIVLFLILHSTSEEKEKQVESIMRRQIKLQILKEDVLDECFKKFKPILKDNLFNSRSLINLANSLLKCNTEPLVQTFASHMYEVMFIELTDCGQIIVAELLKMVLNHKKSVLNTLNILNNIASKNLLLLNQQCLQTLTLLDRMDHMTLTEVRAVMNLVCRLAFSVENSDIRDSVLMIIKKELGSCIPSIKILGIFAGIHAVKYLTISRNDENTADLPDEDSDDAITLSMTPSLLEGDLQVAAQLIRLINKSTEHFPDMIALFYDELYKIVQQSTEISKIFVGWLNMVLTNNWQENFLVGNLDKKRLGEIEISSQFCLNKDSEVDEHYSVNIAGLTLEDDKNVHIEILSPLFQLVRALHYKKYGELSKIDALLGFGIVMPIVDIDLIVELSESQISYILDCYIHCVNWIRELLNAFTFQEDDGLIPKILNRLLHLDNIENTIEVILSKKHVIYKPPYYFSQAINISNIREQVERRTLNSQVTKQKKGKKSEDDDTVVPESGKSQQTQMGTVVKNTFAAIHNIQFRPLNLTLIELLRYDLTPDDVSTKLTKLTFGMFNYILRHMNGSLNKILISRIKKQTFFTKDTMEIYSRPEAESQVKRICDILPKVMKHIDTIKSFIDCHIVDKINPDNMYILKINEGCLCLEHIYNLLTIYFRWIEFKNKDVHVILHNSLKIVGKVGNNELFSMVTLLKSFQEHEKYCTTLSCAVSLIELMKALQEHSNESNIQFVLKETAHHFISQQWEDHDKSIDMLFKVYLDNNTITELKDIVTLLVNDVKELDDRSSVLPNLKSITKSNFILFFRSLGTAFYNQIKSHWKPTVMSDVEQVELWGTVATILNLMFSIMTTVGTKTMTSAFFKTFNPVLNIFLSTGVPNLKKALKDHRQNILNVIKDFEETIMLSYKMFSDAKRKFNRALIKKIPRLESNLLIAIDYVKDFKQLDVNDERISKNGRKGKKLKLSAFNVDVTVEDCDNDLTEDLDFSDASSDFNENNHAGISDVV